MINSACVHMYFISIEIYQDICIYLFIYIYVDRYKMVYKISILDLEIWIIS